MVTFSQLAVDRGDIMRRLAGQLVDAAGSIGANLEEAADAQSKADFIHKNCLALKEARETRFWLRLISASDPQMRPPAAPLIQESVELIAILTAIVVRAKRSKRRGGPNSA